MIKVIKKPRYQTTWVAVQWRNGLYVAELPRWFFDAFTERRLRMGPNGLYIPKEVGDIQVLYGDYLLCQPSGEIFAYTEYKFWDEFQKIDE